MMNGWPRESSEGRHDCQGVMKAGRINGDGLISQNPSSEREVTSIWGKRTLLQSAGITEHSLWFVIFILAHWNDNFQHWQKIVVRGLCNKLVLHCQVSSDKQWDDNVGTGIITRLFVPGPLLDEHRCSLSCRLVYSDVGYLLVLCECLNPKHCHTSAFKIIILIYSHSQCYVK